MTGPGQPADSITYDVEGRMVTVTVNGQPHVAYDYDAQGRRVRAVVGSGAQARTTHYVYDPGGRLLAEYGGLVTETPGRRYVVADHLGSTRMVLAT